MKAPCKDCQDRYSGCLKVCTRFKKYEDEKAEIKKKMNADRLFAMPAVNTLIRKEKFRKSGLK